MTLAAILIYEEGQYALRRVSMSMFQREYMESKQEESKKCA